MQTSAPPVAHAVRLLPGADLRESLESHARSSPLPAAGVVSGVGSLTVARIRLAGATEIRTMQGPWELVSLSGTLGAGGAHLHAMVADLEGRCIGGHVCAGCIVHTTAELVLLELPGLRFERTIDPQTGYLELDIGSLAGATRTPGAV